MSTATQAQQDGAPSVVSAEMDTEALASWLRERIATDGPVRLAHISAPKTGFSAKTLLLSVEIHSGGKVDTRDLVVRLEQPGNEIFLDTDMARQGDMMRALRQCGIRAPVVVGIERDRSILGGQFLVTERVKGQSLPQHPSYHVAGLLHDLDPAGRGRMWADAVGHIAQVNRLDWRQNFAFLNKPSYGAPGLDQYLGWLGAWREESGGGRPHAILDAGMDYLRREKPQTDNVSVLWGDSNIGNMLFADDGAVAGILDFEAAALGPGEIDLGWWFFMDAMLSFGVPRLEGLPSREAQIALYENLCGRTVEALDYYEMLAGVRMVLVMVRTVDRMIAAGQIPADSRAATANPVVQILADRLGLPGEPTGADYMTLVTAANQRG